MIFPDIISSNMMHFFFLLSYFILFFLLFTSFGCRIHQEMPTVTRCLFRCKCHSHRVLSRLLLSIPVSADLRTSLAPFFCEIALILVPTLKVPANHRLHSQLPRLLPRYAHTHHCPPSTVVRLITFAALYFTLVIFPVGLSLIQNDNVFSRLDDPAQLLTHTSKYQIPNIGFL